VEVIRIVVSAAEGVRVQTPPEIVQAVADIGTPGEQIPVSEIRESTEALVRSFVDDPSLTRLAFAGYVPQGRAGIVLNRSHGRLVEITGHKLETVRNENLFLEAQAYDPGAIDEGLRAFLLGMTVRLRADSGEVILRWDPFLIQAFGSGRDTNEAY
jgi:hypothetical protein